MNDEMQIIKKILPQMAGVMNVVPGEPFYLKEAETLSVLHRRMPQSDLQKLLEVFNEVFSKKDGLSVADLKEAAVCYVKMKVLLEHEEDNFSPYSTRDLIKEYKAQKTKIANIIRLSEMNAMTAEEYAKERIEQTLEKNRAFMDSFDEDIAKVEKKLERLPALRDEEVTSSKEEPEEKAPDFPKKKAAGVLDRIGDVISSVKDRHETNEKLKDAEKQDALTKCKEIPFYDRILSYTDVIDCKDIPAYSLLKRKNNVYFGLTKNIKKTGYDNSDQSLIELTEATEEFIQFMSVDLLDGEYELKPFSQKEKQGLVMYFDFMSGCFKKNIGITLTVQEYLNFKAYYNRLIRKMLELEEEGKEEYYRSLILSDSYFSYMEAYDLICNDDADTVIANIIAEENESYIEDLDLILEHHIVDENANADLFELKQKIIGFHEKNLPEEKKEPPGKKPEVITQPLVGLGMYPQIGMPMMPMINQGMMQIVIQILDENREIVDEALYAGQNMQQALFDYQNRDGFIKRIGFRNNGQDVFCMENMED